MSKHDTQNKSCTDLTAKAAQRALNKWLLSSVTCPLISYPALLCFPSLLLRSINVLHIGPTLICLSSPYHDLTRFESTQSDLTWHHLIISLRHPAQSTLRIWPARNVQNVPTASRSEHWTHYCPRATRDPLLLTLFQVFQNDVTNFSGAGLYCVKDVPDCMVLRCVRTYIVRIEFVRGTLVELFVDRNSYWCLDLRSEVM